MDPVLLWLWRRPAVAAPIGPLAWEFPYAAGTAIKKKKRKEKKRNEEQWLPGVGDGVRMEESEAICSVRDQTVLYPDCGVDM